MASIKKEHQGGERDEFNQKICDFKHEEIDKRFDDLKDQILENNQMSKEVILEAIKNTEIRLKMEIQGKEENLKNKIIVSEKGMNEKIDAIDSFQDTLRGNGEPGIKESMRLLELKVKSNFIILGVLILLIFGGEFWGVTASSIRKYFTQQTKKEETVNKDENNEALFHDEVLSSDEANEMVKKDIK